MRFDWATLALQTVNLLILIWILSRFLFRPVADIVARRRAAAGKLLDDAKAIQAEAERARQSAEAEAAKLAQGRADALRAAAAEAETLRRTLIAAARKEASDLVAHAHEDACRQREDAAAAISERAGELALDIAERLMQRLPDRSRIAGFVAGLADAIAALPEANRAEIGAGGAPLRVKAARKPEPGEAEDCRKALERALGRPVELIFEIAPKLIAGLEIETPHARVRNSLRADLDRLAKEFKSDDAALPT